MKKLLTSFALVCLFYVSAHATDKPNIVLVFMDNFGWGEPGFNGGGIIRGAPTPRLDRLAAEGIRLTNFNVEAQCTPSRSAIMTGRYAIRSGNGIAPDVVRRRLQHGYVRQMASRSHQRPLSDGSGF
ncbi:MAG: sulfatase-like hydrolase/transferase [Planctomycetota bacterium]